jgi:hypothetical protein
MTEKRSHPAFSRYSLVRDPEKRIRLRNEYIQEVIYSLVLKANGPLGFLDITRHFGTMGGGRGAKKVRENLNILTDENWGPGPLIKVVDGKYVLNDEINPED